MTGAAQSPFPSENHDHGECITEALQAAERLCRMRRVRLTQLRRKVLELIWSDHKPVGAYTLLAKLQQDGPAAPPTVYRALDFLLEHGLIHRLASLNAFVGCARPESPHGTQFLICESCQNLAELDDGEIASAISRSTRASGFSPLRQTVEILGLCPQCRE